LVKHGDFSVKKWAAGKENTNRNVYITWREDMRNSQLPLVAAWVDTFCAAILSSRPEDAPRIWLFLDELESLGKLESLVPAATKGRKHGLRIVATIQDWSQLDTQNGHDVSKTILGCFRAYAIFGASNAYNSDRASEILGKQVVERTHYTKSAFGRILSQSVQTHTEPVVMDSEISNLKDLEGFIMFAEDFPMARIKLEYFKYHKKNEGIVSKPISIKG